MCPRRSGENLCDLLGYTFPKIHEGKDWYVDFYCKDPHTGTVRRKKYYVPAAKTKRARRDTTALMADRISQRLRNGWNPWIEEEKSKSYSKIEEVFEKFLSNVENSFRASTVHSYRSMLNVFREYLSTLTPAPVYSYQIDRPLILDFLDWTVRKRSAGAWTRNNYKGWCSVLGSFMVERGYLSENGVRLALYLLTASRRQPS